MKADKEFINMSFRYVYDRKWKSQGKSQKEFARAVRAIDPECGINNTYVSKLYSGKYTPSARYLSLFCKVLNVEMEEFYPETMEGKYRYSPDYQDEVEEYKEIIAQDCFGLNLSFLYGLKQMINFDEEFPIFAPLQCNVADPVDGFPFGLKYDRVRLVEAAESKHSLFQISIEGKTINLSPADMKFLKALQNYVIRKVRELFKFHKQELIDSVNEATDSCKEYMRPGKTIELGKSPLSAEALQDVDKWGLYSNEEYKKYKLPVSPEELQYTAAYYIDGWKAIHFGKNMDIKPVYEWLNMLNDGGGTETSSNKKPDSIENETKKIGGSDNGKC